MASYKVPQDVEAEDKLIGPFSFRQFIYLMVAGLGIFFAWLLSRIFIGLFIIPMPVVVAMLALALPLRKDQPMETYLIAMIRFFFKPRHRLWSPGGEATLVRITAPKVDDSPQLKDFSGSEASQRLEYLSQIVDTHGWSTRGVMSSNDGMSDIFIADTSRTEDVLDETSNISQSLDQRITQKDDQYIQAVKDQFQQSMQQTQQPAPVSTPQQPVDPAPAQDAQPQDDNASVGDPVIHFNPYPVSMHQHVLDPNGQKTPQPAASSQAQEEKPGSNTVSPDIIRLANNNDLSISAIAREANRLSDDDNQEVVISLR